ncbi:MAG TPA: site-specific integrase, partial [Bacillota bacterium]|nr:site-specific integrase [Bacillota bacterium]
NPENPIKGITEPKVEKEEPEVLTEEEVYRFVDTSRIVAPELTNLFIVCILTGIRKGEAFGLRWSDIDFNKRTIHISQQLIKDGINPIFSQPKTYTGRRTIPISDNAINALLEEKDKQDDFKANQPQYNDYDLVFSQSNGRPLSHKSTYKKIHKCFKAAFADKDYGFHVFRHSFISIHLNNGTPIATVSELSGHRQTSTTLNMYAHAYENTNIAAAKQIDDLIFGDGQN